jgi:oxygen-independent coproporphyrinogen-3 oxidase
MPELMPPLLALYIHIPWCVKKCPYCDFNSHGQKSELPLADYIAALTRDLEQDLPLVWGRSISSVFFGGGTPSLFSGAAIGEILSMANSRLRFAPNCEITLECNPGTAEHDRFASYLAAGVNRLSFGVQSFDDVTLDALGRRHSPKQIMEAWELIEAAGFASRNLDLIFAIPGQDEKRWTDDLYRAMELKPDHLSTYCLTFEEDTAMFVKLSQGKVKIDRELEAFLYRRTWETLAENGYAQYETSNFAQAGHACRHNLITWEMGSWIGYGPSAASQWGHVRWTNPANLDQWVKGIEAGQPVREQAKALSARDLLCDALVFGLRLNEGVDPFALAERFETPLPQGVRDLFADLVEEELMELAGTRFRLNGEGRMRADAVGVAVLEKFD